MAMDMNGFSIKLKALYLLFSLYISILCLYSTIPLLPFRVLHSPRVFFSSRLQNNTQGKINSTCQVKGFYGGDGGGGGRRCSAQLCVGLMFILFVLLCMCELLCALCFNGGWCTVGFIHMKSLKVTATDRPVPVD